MTAMPIRRARPLLGTFVEISVQGLMRTRAEDATGRAFAEIAAVHRLMSFHEAGSDLDRLHRARIGARVAVDARTHEVLAWCARIAAASAGRFDPTVAARQVAHGLLPRPASPWTPQARADWRDIELPDSKHVRLARPLWIDLGGIAKGYAVDRALDILVDAGATQVCVNAGGDLRVAGARSEIVHLRIPAGILAAPACEIHDGALATSGTLRPSTHCAPGLQVPPIDGRRRRAFARPRIVAVAADRCIVADALTKVVMAGDGRVAQRVLAAFGAQSLGLDCDSTPAPIGAAA
jgi:thiamine biosynthesis lipoprotein